MFYHNYAKFLCPTLFFPTLKSVFPEYLIYDVFHYFEVIFWDFFNGFSLFFVFSDSLWLVLGESTWGGALSFPLGGNYWLHLDSTYSYMRKLCTDSNRSTSLSRPSHRVNYISVESLLCPLSIAPMWNLQFHLQPEYDPWMWTSNPLCHIWHVSRLRVFPSSALSLQGLPHRVLYINVFRRCPSSSLYLGLWGFDQLPKSMTSKQRCTYLYGHMGMCIHVMVYNYISSTCFRVHSAIFMIYYDYWSVLLLFLPTTSPPLHFWLGPQTWTPCGGTHFKFHSNVSK